MKIDHFVKRGNKKSREYRARIFRNRCDGLRPKLSLQTFGLVDRIHQPVWIGFLFKIFEPSVDIFAE
jgi:hypothetical protein